MEDGRRSHLGGQLISAVSGTVAGAIRRKENKHKQMETTMLIHRLFKSLVVMAASVVEVNNRG